jgi:hypothetical protein
MMLETDEGRLDAIYAIGYPDAKPNTLRLIDGNDSPVPGDLVDSLHATPGEFIAWAAERLLASAIFEAGYGAEDEEYTRAEIIRLLSERSYQR